MKKQTRFPIASLLIACLLTSGLLIQSQLFSQSSRSAKAVKVERGATTPPSVNEIGPDNPPVAQPYLDAGGDATMCEESGLIKLNGQSTYKYKTIWETSGDGEFADPTSAKTAYMPGEHDVTSGEVTLYLVLIIPNSDQPPVYDSMDLSFADCISSNDGDDYE